MSARLLLTIVLLALTFLGCVQTAAPVQESAPSTGPAVSEEQTFRFVVMSDRTGGMIPGLWAQAAEEVRLLAPDFVMCVGDLIEGYTEDVDRLHAEWDEFDAIAARLGAPFHYCAGNHDVGNAPSLAVYEQRHGVDGRSWYSFDYQGCHFIVLDASTHDLNAERRDEQIQWLRVDLAAAGDPRWTFVFWHQPRPMGHPMNAPIVESLDPSRVTIFNGHEHSTGYREDEGFSIVRLAATGAGVPAGGADLGGEQVFAMVTMTPDGPRIATIPVGQVRAADAVTDAFVQSYRQAMSETRIWYWPDGLGWHAEAQQSNPLDRPMEVRFAVEGAHWTSRDLPWRWQVEPGRLSTDGTDITACTAEPGPGRIVATYTIPNEQGRAVVTQRSFEFPQRVALAELDAITVDGRGRGDWPAEMETSVTERDRVVADAGAWTGRRDLSMRVQFGVAGDRLCALVNVYDDVVNTDGPEYWHKDAVAIAWDARPVTRQGGRYTPGAGQMVFLAGETGPAEAIFPDQPGEMTRPEGVEAAIVRWDEGGYTLELAVPLASLGGVEAIEPGGSIRLDVAVFDRDDVEGLGPITRMVAFGDGSIQRTTDRLAFVIRP